MGLRLRLLLVLLVCALVPALGGVVLATGELRALSREEDSRGGRATAVAAASAVEMQRLGLERALDAACNDPALGPLASDALGLGVEGALRAEARERWRALRERWGVSLLVLKGAGSAGSWTDASQGVTASVAWRARLAPPTSLEARSASVRLAAPESDGPLNGWALRGRCVPEGGEGTVALELAAPVDPALLTPGGLRLHLEEGTHGVAVGSSRVRVVGATTPVPPSAGWLLGALVLGLAVAVAVVLWLLVGPGLVRPVEDVALAADRIAEGTRSIQVDTHAGGEVGKLIAAFNRMARRLDDADTKLRRAERIAAWRDIARQMAHEIKNPLTPIQMAVEMLRKARERQLPDFEELFDEQTQIVLEEVARLRRLVENFSRFARAPKPRPEWLPVGDLLSHVVGLHQGHVAEVTGEVEGEAPKLRADREQLTQVLVNLVGNAVLAAEERARSRPERGPAAVHVTASAAPDGQVRLAVEDNGGGIDPGVLARLFEPYVTTRAGRGGTGLGLAVAWRIVHEHGGTITAETSELGTRFEVLLPAQGPSVEPTLETTRSGL